MEQSVANNDFFASESDLEIQIKDARGSYLFDENGRRYIDFAMGWCVGNLGWKHPEVEKAISHFDGPTYVSPHFAYRPWVELAELLADVAPGNLKRSFRATGGTEAVEIALQAAMKHTGRSNFIAIQDAYHGNSIAAHALVSDSKVLNWKKLSPPLNENALEKLESLLKERDVAALIMEPILINLGVHIPDKKFMQGMQELCRKYGTLIIMDEVASGFGRTGKLFATEHFKLEPDIMTLAKGISGGAAPLGATIMTEEVAKSLEEESFPYSTYGWHPLSVTGALANIRFMQENWSFLEENMTSMNEYFRQRLTGMNFKSTPEMSIMGLAIHVDFEDSDYGEKLSSRAQEKGLILAGGISMYPAINIDFETAREGLDILESCL